MMSDDITVMSNMVQNEVTTVKDFNNSNVYTSTLSTQTS